MPANASNDLVFLKLGGSLITDKRAVERARPDVLRRLAQEVRRARDARPHLRLLLGHGSGSFGHVAARRHGTRTGVQGEAAWLGFATVADAAARLNRSVVNALLAEDVPVWSLQPSAATHCAGGAVRPWRASLIEMALGRGLVPLVYGDAMLDETIGGTIASTEELFAMLAGQLRPRRILLAGTVDGVYSGDPLTDPAVEHWPLITLDSLPELRHHLGGSHGVDVTGGMLSKVDEMCRLVAADPGLEIRLFSGLRPEAVLQALLNRPDAGGTLIRSR